MTARCPTCGITDAEDEDDYQSDDEPICTDLWHIEGLLGWRSITPADSEEH